MDIVVNGKRFDVPRTDVTYEAIAGLAGHPDSKELLVVYRARMVDGNLEKAGTLIPGRSVTPCDGMIFNAVHTGGA